MYLVIEGFGEPQFARELMRFKARGMDMAPAFRKVVKYLRRVESRQFTSQGANSGGWTPLASSTVAYKAKHGYDPRILHRTLRLRKSLTREGAPDSVVRISRDEMFYGSSVPYGVFHQRGTRHMPKRRPVELTPAHKVKIVKILQAFLVEGLHR